jgi:hypothetical protein
MHHPMGPSMLTQSARGRVALAAACVAFTFVYLTTAIFFRNSFLNDPDTFLHISVGNWILQHGRFPFVDQFSYTAFGNPWFATDWISELIFASLYKASQWRGVTEIVAVTAALISAVLCLYLVMKLRLAIGLGLAVIITALISPHFLARPVILSYLLLSVWIILILEVEDRNNWSKQQAFILMPLMLLWANVHGSFTFGLAVFYLFLCNTFWDAYKSADLPRCRRLIVLLIGVTISAFITPYGPFPTLKTVKLMSDPVLTTIDEWRAPDFQHDPFHLATIIGLFALLAYFGIKLRGPRLLTLLLVTVFALEHKRGLGLFALVGPLLLVRPLATRLPWIRVHDAAVDPVIRFANRHCSSIALACTTVVAIAGVTMWTIGPQIHPPRGRAPDEAIAAAKHAGITGNVLNSHGFGGYLIFEGIPPFVDGRVELYGNQFLQRYFDAMNLSSPDDAIRIIKKYDIRWALLQPGEPIAFMLKADGWVQLYGDHVAIVLVKSP